MPVLSVTVFPVVEDVPVRLKQYRVLVVKSLLEKVTDCPETFVAILLIPGQAVAPEGRLLISVVQFPVFVETVKSFGKVTIILFSTPAPEDELWAQIVPERGAFAV